MAQYEKYTVYKYRRISKYVEQKRCYVVVYDIKASNIHVIEIEGMLARIYSEVREITGKMI